MRILFLSSLYSTPLAPERGIPNARILHAMRAHAEIRVVAPVPWYPPVLARRRPAARALATLPEHEPDDDGSPVWHPRWLHLPRIDRVLQAGLYGASVLGPLREAVARFRPDVLLSAWAYPDGTAASALGKLLGLPTVVRVMGSDINAYTHSRPRRLQIAWALRNAGGVIAVSPALGRKVATLGVDPTRVAVIPTGVDTTVFHPMDRDQARAALGLPPGALILVPARLSPEKGVHCFLDALAELGPEVRAVICGDGAQAGMLRARARRLGVAERVIFAGFQPPRRMQQYYAAADLVCLPSLEEGWPNVLMESFACGAPVVASEVGGVPDIIALTGAGLTAPAGDPRALARALRDALGRHWDRAATATAMQAHTLARTAQRYLEACEHARRVHEHARSRPAATALPRDPAATDRTSAPASPP